MSRREGRSGAGDMESAAANLLHKVLITAKDKCEEALITLGGKVYEVRFCDEERGKRSEAGIVSYRARH